MRSRCAVLPSIALVWLASCVHGPAWAPATPSHWTAWTSADKLGFGTARRADSPVWFTLGRGRLTEVYYPRLDVPSVRELVFWVADGEGAQRVDLAADTQVALVDPRALAYREVSAAHD